jgi:hypothetical protein
MNRRAFLGAAAMLPAALQNRSGRTTPHAAPGRVETLRSVRALPVEIVGEFRDPLAFEQDASGQYYVFDRMGHTVYGIDQKMSGGWKIVQIGREAGRIIEPTAFAVAPNGTFVVSDRPGALERVQQFDRGGNLLQGFTLPGRAGETVVIGSVVLNGVGSVQYDGRSLFINQPETGGLVTEYSTGGVPSRTFGTLRATGHEDDREVHVALNSGLPLVNPGGGFFFVFQAGVPMFRRYDDRGTFVYERHVEGIEIDRLLNALPTTWPRRRSGDREMPLIAPVVRTARVDPWGNLWIAFSGIPFTYVYDADGDKVRVVQFAAAGIVRPTSLFFSGDGRLLVTPGCYEFAPGRGRQ